MMWVNSLVIISSPFFPNQGIRRVYVLSLPTTRLMSIMLCQCYSHYIVMQSQIKKVGICLSYAKKTIHFSLVPSKQESTTLNWFKQRFTDISTHTSRITIVMLCSSSCASIRGILKNLIDSTKRGNLNWSVLKQEADIIVSTLKEAGQSLYDPLPHGKSVPQFQ